MIEITTTTEQGRVPVTVFHLAGELGADSYEYLQQQAQKAFDAGSRYMLLDLRRVTFLSSSGLRAIHHIFSLLRSPSEGEGADAVRSGIAAGTYKSPHLKLLGPSRRVADVLKAAGFDMFLEVYSDLPAAIASF